MFPETDVPTWLTIVNPFFTDRTHTLNKHAVVDLLDQAGEVHLFQEGKHLFFRA